MARRKSMNITGKGISILKDANGQKLNAKEIAQQIFDKYPEDCEAKRSRSARDLNDEDLVQQLAREWYSYWKISLKKEPSLRSTEDRPRLFYITSEDEEENEAFEPETSTTSSPNLPRSGFTEHDLYPVLGEFVATELSCLSMRIDERRSKNSHGARGNQWLYPDVVGMIPLSSGWHPEVSELAATMGTSSVRLCSFEVKKTINRSNVREVVFQTVSNSSWANFAYLSAVTLESKAAEELRLLCLAHGIGYIALNRNEPAESQITIPAKFNDKVNYDLVTRLASENKDAVRFLENVTTFLKTGKDRSSDWDLFPTPSK